jgi:pimeloyl-ACP methyl ester carboxylesterase
VRLSTERLGAGEKTTVLLHGFLGSGKNLRTLAQRWSEKDPSRTFLLPDLRGHGSSPPLDEGMSLGALAADVFDTVRAEGLSLPADVVGHSLGGRVALAGSLTASEQVRSVTLLDISPSPIPTNSSESGAVLRVLLEAPAQAPDRKTLRSWLLAHGLSEHLSDWLLMNVAPSSAGGYAWTFDRAALDRLHARVNQEDLWAAVEDSKAPVRCIRGGKSSYVSEEDAARMTRAGCPVETLEGAGHYVHVQALAALVDLLSR